MKDYTRGLRDGMLETAKADLEQVATRIAILEEDLHKERDRKWDLIRKIKLLEAGQDPSRLLDKGEAMTLGEKIDLIKRGFPLENAGEYVQSIGYPTRESSVQTFITFREYQGRFCCTHDGVFS